MSYSWGLRDADGIPIDEAVAAEFYGSGNTNEQVAIKRDFFNSSLPNVDLEFQVGLNATNGDGVQGKEGKQ